jgi:hypothetical protein
VTHFEKALEAHCRFRHHHPVKDEMIEKEVTKTVKRIKKADEPESEKKMRKPRAKKTAVKEQK